MNIRPDAWRRAFRAPQVILSLLALAGALVAVFLARPVAIEVEPFELPVVEERPVTTEEVRIITFDRFNLEIPLLTSLQVPEHAQHRVEAIVAAVREQLQGQDGAWPDWLQLPVVFVEELDGVTTAVLDFRTLDPDAHFGESGFSRLRRSLEATLTEAGLGQVVLLHNGEPPRPLPEPTGEDESG